MKRLTFVAALAAAALVRVRVRARREQCEQGNGHEIAEGRLGPVHPRGAVRERGMSRLRRLRLRTAGDVGYISMK